MKAPVVVVGAALAGLRAVQELRQLEYDGEVVLIGGECGLPYDRPPLSKSFLSAEEEPTADLCTAEELADLAVTHITGIRAQSVDEEAQIVRLADGQTVPYSRLLVATGLEARLPSWCSAVPGVHTLRTRDDARALRQQLAVTDHLIVVGGGFIGTEVAATARALGVDVTLVIREEYPLQRQLGTTVAGYLHAMHTARGVTVRPHANVQGLVDGQECSGVRLATGEVLAGDAVVMAVGGVPAVDWLEGTSVHSPFGVHTHETGRASEQIWAAGDIVAGHAGHWQAAVSEARAAARAMIGAPPATSRIPEFAYFWTDQYDAKIQLVGASDCADNFRVVAGDPRTMNFTGTYLRAGAVTGVLVVNRPRDLAKARLLLARGADFATYRQTLAA